MANAAKFFVLAIRPPDESRSVQEIKSVTTMTQLPVPIQYLIFLACKSTSMAPSGWDWG